MSDFSPELPAKIPKAPESKEGLLEWAKRLVAALTQKEDFVNSGFYTLKYAGTVEFNSSISSIAKMAVTGNVTINGRAGTPGPVYLILTNDAGAGHVITFGTNFKTSGTLTGTTNKTAIIEFISDGTTLYEVGRKTGL
jgi:hypothetical protein